MGKLAETLYSLRKDRGLTQSELSDAIGVSRSSIGMYERGDRNPDFKTLEKMAIFFGVSIDHLIRSDSKVSAAESDDLEAWAMYGTVCDNLGKLSGSDVTGIVAVLLKLSRDGLREAEKRLREMSRLREYSVPDRYDFTGYYRVSENGIQEGGKL